MTALTKTTHRVNREGQRLSIDGWYAVSVLTMLAMLAVVCVFAILTTTVGV